MTKVKITELLKAHSSGDQKALDKLMPLVYDEMRGMAHYRLLGERSGHTLNTTDLVHEAYLKLVEFNRIDWENRAHFFGIASQVMRNILVDYAVKKKAQKRGGDRQRVTLGKQNIATQEVSLNDVLAVHQALNQLAEKDLRLVRIVECRFFGGLSLEETAKALGISTATVSRDWKMARAWLNRELSKNGKK
ncbi:MAG: sigma-70 family RNA polymerase sigma factor [candidate division Zixibacteria bacterium]|nr:sigma-70 family RNA polymerase sigma factor [candidate division KSB1 bacterium]NIR66332.1 sigma-70 family RNA polymerase sigma factor [candidate division Zixibacteria bacterium]NIW47470.1 sigma-70 family RNA polymerase sigma factor [Gammaproteobacteria bacterium]NIS47941.1 sigma-70 family RNA polymerase sigma factor [candidate division Zixibacteria bacterium]NIT73899.1 sigma-70 family RNA polymerase sigma factor [candidate division KSB1 bacterium]